jgi:hypothetical protein
MNAPVKYGLTPEERQRRLEVYEEQCRARQQESANAEATLLALAQLLAQRGR